MVENASGGLERGGFGSEYLVPRTGDLIHAGSLLRKTLEDRKLRANGINKQIAEKTRLLYMSLLA